MVESHRMSRGQCQAEETIGLLCTEGFMIMKVDPDTKMVLCTSAGAVVLLRQRVCVTAPLFTRTFNCISPVK